MNTASLSTPVSSLNLDSANADLLALYRDAWRCLWRDLKSQEGVSGPHFVRVTDAYASAPVRFAIIGQETAGKDWADTPETQMGLYPETGIVERRKGTPFWKAAREIAADLGAEILWANLVLVDTHKKRSPEAIRDAARHACGPRGMLPGMLEATAPHATLFVTGPSGYYRYELEQQFPGIEIEPVDGFDVRAFARLRHPDLPAASFRSYHPAYLWRSGRRSDVARMSAVLRNALNLPPEVSPVTESLWRVADDPVRAQTLFPEVDGIETCEWAYAVEASGGLVAGRVGTAHTAESFARIGAFDAHLALNRPHLRSRKRRALWDAATLLGAFEASGGEAVRAFGFTFPTRPLVDAVLWESRGVLLWRHQVERLTELSGLAPESASALRQRLARGDASAHDESRSVEITPGVSLADVIDERAAFGGFFFSLPLRRAGILSAAMEAR